MAATHFVTKSPANIDSVALRVIHPPPRSRITRDQKSRFTGLPGLYEIEAPRERQRVTGRANHDRMANAIRALSMDAVEAAKSGHPGLPMGVADVATVLFTKFLKFDPADPKWPDRDRFILSAGHGSMLLYSLLYLLGYPGMTIEEIKRFRQLDSKTPGHPENFVTEGVETTTGPLGQGLGNAVGMALAEQILAAEFGAEAVDHFTYVLASDGDLMEGISQEAIALAGHLRLAKLIVLFDDNHITIDGGISLSDSTDQVARVQASGWNATRIDGHDPDAIAKAIEAAQKSDKPTLIACRTTIGFGAPKKAGTSEAHGSPLGAEEIKGAREKLGWHHPPFEIPVDLLAEWRKAGTRSQAARKQWTDRVKTLPADKRAEFERRIAGKLPGALIEAVRKIKTEAAAKPTEIATRKASELALGSLVVAVPEMVGGSADLTGSNNTKTKSMPVIAPSQFKGQFMHWGIREHGMASAMNGMALHGGIIPFSGTFLVFSDYCRPSLRLASLMELRAIHVMTHDSIGLGEDGPTHQPVEHLAALRAIPNLLLFRPADLTETAECWQLALEYTDGPSVLALTRQNLPALRTSFEEKNLCARGAYELAPANGDARVSLFASGSEVSLCIAAKAELEKQGVPTRVVSVPCLDLFLAEDAGYRAEVIGNAPIRIACEAAIRLGWDQVIGSEGAFVGMTSFGASAPYKELYRRFGITTEAIVAAAFAGLGDKREFARKERA